MNEQELCKKRLIDLSKQANRKGIVLFSDFLNLNEQNIYQQNIKLYESKTESFGGVDRVLKTAAGIGEVEVRRGRRDDDDINIFGFHTGGFEGFESGRTGKVAGGLLRLGNVSLGDTGTGADPFVTGIHHSFHIGIGDDPLRQIRSGSGDSYAHSSLNISEKITVALRI